MKTKEEKQAYHRAYHESHKDHIKTEQQAYYKSHRAELQAYGRAHGRAYYAALRHDAIMSYGGYECVCNHDGKQCGVTTPEFLSIDHINNDGTAHRKAIGGGGKIYKWLRDNNYPYDFRILCHNCNLARGFYKQCPLT